MARVRTKGAVQTVTQPERFVIWNDELGLMLGNCCWSLRNHGNGVDKAPVFGKTDGAKIAQMFQGKMILVAPDIIKGPLEYASEERCVRAGIPHWNPSLYVPDPDD